MLLMWMLIKATELALQAEKAALEADERIINSNGASFNSHTGVKGVW